MLLRIYPDIQMFMFRIADGKVVETWGVVDVCAQMKQIGVI